MSPTRRDHAADAEIEQRPWQRARARTQPEIVARDQHLGVAIRTALVEMKSGFSLAVILVALPPEESLARPVR